MRSVILLLTMSLSSAATPAQPVLQWDFETTKPDGALVQLLTKPQVDLIPGEGRNGSTALRVTYEGYEQGSKRVVQQIPLPGSYRAATLNYAVRFAPDWLFVKGGKLHGLGPDHPITGGREMTPDGWSARVTWGGDSPKIYAYHQSKTSQYGVGSKAEDLHFATGRWYELAIYVQVNDPADASNGVVEMYVDGKLLAQDTDLRFRAVDAPGTMITRFLFSTFHGGHTPEYAPRDEAGKAIDVHAFFDDFAVYEGRHIRAAQP